MKKHFLLLLCLLPFLPLLAQNGGDDGMKCYDDIKAIGDRHFAKKKFKEAEKTYKAAKECLTTVVNAGNLFLEIDSFISLADAADKKQRDDALARAEQKAREAEAAANDARLAREKALADRRTALANDYAYKASTMLREGDRSGAFTLAAFALQFVDTASARSKQALLDAFYFNDHPLRSAADVQRLPWSNTLLGHTDLVNDVAFSPEGRRIATVSSDATLKIWDAESGEEQATFRHGTEALHTLAFSPSGDTLAVAGADKIIHLLDLRTRKSWLLLPRPGSEQPAPNLAQQTAPSKSGGQPNDRRQSTGKPAPNEKNQPAAESPTGHTLDVIALAWHPNGKWLASASMDSSVKIWNPRTSELLQTLHAPDVADLAFSPDGKRFGYVSGQGSITVWRLVESGSNPLATSSVTSFPNDFFSAIAFPPDSTLLAVSSSATQVIYLIQHDSLVVREFPSYDVVSDLAFSPGGDTLASVSGNYYNTTTPVTKIWEVSTGKQLLALSGHSDWINAVAFSPDGKRIATASADQTVSISDLDGRAELETLQLTTQPIRLAFSADRQWLATLCADETLQLRLARNPSRIEKLYFNATAFTFSDDGKWLAYAQRQHDPSTGTAYANLVVLVDLATGIARKLPTPHGNDIRSLAISADGELLLSGGRDGLAITTNLKTGQLEYPPTYSPTRDAGITSVAFSKDGKWAAAAISFEIVIWNALTGKTQFHFSDNLGSVSEVVFSPDGIWLASACDDTRVKIWNVQTGREQFTLAGHSLPVLSVAYSPDGSKILTSSGVKPLDYYDYSAAAGYRNRMSDSPVSDTLEDAAILPPADTLQPDSLLLPGAGIPASTYYDLVEEPVAATSETDNTLRIWDARTGAELLTLSGHAMSVTDAAFAPGGNRLASCSADGRVHFWQTSLDSLLERQKTPTLTKSKIEKLNLREGLDALGGGVSRMEKLMTKPQLLAFAWHFGEKTYVSSNPAVVGDAYEKAFQIYRALETKYGDTSHRETVARLHDEFAMKHLMYESALDRSQSMRHLEEAMRLMPDDYTVNLHHAHGLLFSGRFSEAAAKYLELKLTNDLVNASLLDEFKRFNARQLRCEEVENMVRLLTFDQVDQWIAQNCGIAQPPYAVSENELVTRLDSETAFLYNTLKYKSKGDLIESPFPEIGDWLHKALDEAKTWQQAFPRSKKAVLALDRIYLDLMNLSIIQAQQDSAHAVEKYREALRWNELVSTTKDQEWLEGSGRIYYEWGRVLFRQKKYAESLAMMVKSEDSYKTLLRLSTYNYNYNYLLAAVAAQKTWLLLQAGEWEAAETASKLQADIYNPYYLENQRLGCHASLLLDRPEAVKCYEQMPVDSAEVIQSELRFFGASEAKIAQVSRQFERMAQVEKDRVAAIQMMDKLNVQAVFADSLFNAGDPAGAFRAIQTWLHRCDSLLNHPLFFESIYGAGEGAKSGRQAWETEKASQLGDGSFYALFMHEPDTAILFSTRSLAIDTSLHWVKTNLAAGYLFSGNWKKAKQAYEEIRQMPGDEIGFATLGEACLDDLKLFKEAGIWSKDVPRAAAVILGRELTKEEQAEFGKPLK